jgi:hypothetical protein
LRFIAIIFSRRKKKVKKGENLIKSPLFLAHANVLFEAAEVEDRAIG